MSRLLFQYLLPLLLPAAVYFAWAWLSRRAGKGETDPLSRVQEGPWFWLVAAGFALMVAGLALTALMGQDTTKGTYQPSRIEDGHIVPGQVK